MDTYSLWQWGGYLVLVCGSVLVVALEKSDKRLNRRPFILSYLTLIIAGPIAYAIIDDMGVSSGVVDFLLGTVFYVFYLHIVRQSAMRARDAGLGKGVVYFSIVPAIGTIGVMALMLQKSVERSDSQNSATRP